MSLCSRFTICSSFIVAIPPISFMGFYQIVIDRMCPSICFFTCFFYNLLRLSSKVQYSTNRTPKKLAYETAPIRHYTLYDMILQRLFELRGDLSNRGRGKAKAPTEFGAKLDMSIDERGLARREKLLFDSYNESDVLIAALDRYRGRTGHYPARMLVDQIYRNRKNLAYCRQRGIRVSGPALGRPKPMTPEEKKQAYIDNTDRIEIERGFSLGKRCYGLGLIRTKLDITTRSSITLSILTMNINHLVAIHDDSCLIENMPCSSKSYLIDLVYLHLGYPLHPINRPFRPFFSTNLLPHSGHTVGS